MRKPQPPAPARTETPRYARIPRWGLTDLPPRAAAVPHRPFAKLTDAVTKLLVATAAAFAFAAVAELMRYLVLLRNRTRLIHPVVLWCSDVFVVGAAVLAAACALAAAVGAVGWLIETRRAVYAAAGRRDPRSPLAIALGCLVPGVNLLWPGVFLVELGTLRDDPRALRAVRLWWAAWVGNGGLVVAALLWRTADTLQAQADGVMFTAFTDAVAAGVAVLTLWALRSIEGHDLLGRDRTARRWVIAVDPAVPVIEPVRPGGRAAGQAQAAGAGADAESRAADETAGDEDNDVEDREYEEVMAK